MYIACRIKSLEQDNLWQGHILKITIRNPTFIIDSGGKQTMISVTKPTREKPKNRCKLN